ncbi:MAG: hypothetical protein CO090_04390, partial [Acidobacteria bacterium CG_4_9_14_3_um_filter_49_7]
GGMKTLVEPDPGCPDKAGCMGALPSMCKGNGEGKADKALRCLEEGLTDVMALCDLPDRFRLRLRTTEFTAHSGLDPISSKVECQLW